MKAYIERPISEKPEKDDNYFVIAGTEQGGENFRAWVQFFDGKFQHDKWSPEVKVLSWLQPVEIIEESPLQKLSTWMDENWTKEEILSDGYLKMFDFEINYHIHADLARSAYIKQLKTPVVNTDVLVTLVDRFIKVGQALFDEKQENPHNKKQGLQKAWNGLAFVLSDAKTIVQPFTTPQPDNKEEKK